MRCEICGEEITEGALACPRCGSPVPRKPEPTGKDGGPGPGSEPGAAAGEVGESFEKPLAPVEEDFIAMAEASVPLEEKAPPPSEFATDIPPSPGDESGITQVSDQTVPPGAAVSAETLELDSHLTGGYKGPEGASVAGAGVQTADDPFGLNITESEPPTLEGEHRRGWSGHTARNIVIMILTFLVVAAVVFVGVYFGFIKDKGVSLESPADTVEEFFRKATANNYADMDEVAVENAPLIEQTRELLIPYDRMGLVDVKKIETTTSELKDDEATVKIDTLELEVMTEKGPETFDFLSMTRPYPLPNIVHLVRKNGKWLIDS